MRPNFFLQKFSHTKIFRSIYFGLGVLWLLLEEGKSKSAGFLKYFNDIFNITEVTRYKDIIIIKLILK